MKNLPKTNTPEVLCFSSMGNEPGLKTESRELTPAAPPAMIDKRIKAAAQVEDMKKAAAKKPLI